MTSSEQNIVPLTKERICQTALAIADEQGLNSVSMRKLARELGVEAMSLYYHVKNKDEILEGMIDEVFREIKIPKEGDWKTKIKQKAQATRDTLLRHPWGLGVIDSRKQPGPLTLKHHNTVIGVFKSAGFSIRDAARAFMLIDSYIYGFVLQEMSLPLNQENSPPTATRMLEHSPEDAYPFLKELEIDYNAKPDYTFENEFNFGLDLILEGLERSYSSGKDQDLLS